MSIHHRKLALFVIVLLCLTGCNQTTTPTQPADETPFSPASLGQLRWEQIVTKTQGSVVRFAQWSGDETRNRFYAETVAATLKRRYGITLELVPTSDLAETVSKLINEKSAGRTSGGSVDLLWINGENFRTARQANVLWGPFADALPNIQYFDPQARQRDFGTAIDGYEAPYQRAQFVIAYDSKRTPTPPRSLAALRDWIKTHPGRFTYLAPPDFTGSAFVRHVLLMHLQQLAGYNGSFDEARYQQALAPTLAWLNEIKPYLWRKGETYPASPKEADRLFANSEIDFTMSYNPSFASERIARGEYPATVRTFVFTEGTLGNYSFLAVPFNASNPAGAVVVANHLLSSGHALAQSQALGSLFPLQIEKLSPAEREAIAALKPGPATLPITELTQHQLAEPDAAYLERLEKDWQERVLRQ